MRSHSGAFLLPLACVALGSIVCTAPARSEILQLPPHPRLIVYGTEVEPTRLEELRSLVDYTGDPAEWSDRKKASVLALRSLRAGAHSWN